mgnify:CR=1 FL=1
MDKTSIKKSANKWHNNLIPWAKDPRTITNESKRAWRDRKRQAQRMMDMLLTYQNMTKSQIEELWKKEDLTVLELLMLKYVTSGMKDNKMLVDMIDRHIAKAPTQMELSWPDGWAISIQDLTFDSGK